MQKIIETINEDIKKEYQEEYDTFLEEVCGKKLSDYKNREEYFKDCQLWFRDRWLGVNIDEWYIGEEFVREISLMKMVKTWRFKSKLKSKVDLETVKEIEDKEYDEEWMLKNVWELVI